MANKEDNPAGGDHQEMVTGFLFPRKPGFDLMQNCDLPPPMKVFACHDQKMILSPPMKNVYTMIDHGQKDEDVGLEMAYEKGNSETEKLELLKALRLSQTRAREAERKVSVLAKEKEDLSHLVVQQSMQLFAYKQWVRLMEFQVSKLNKNQEMQELGSVATNLEGNLPEEEEENEGGKGITTWLMAVAICVGIAGFGFCSLFSSNY